MHNDFLTNTLIFTAIILVLNVIFAGMVVFFERRNPASTWAWLLVLFFIPILGFLMYLIVGRKSNREKVFRYKGKYDKEVYFKYLYQDHHNEEYLQRQKKMIENSERIIEDDYISDLAYLHLNSGNWVTFNNEVDTFFEGNDKFNSLINDIRNAKDYIHLQYYIWRGDDLGKKLVNELAKKAGEGLEVKLIYDGMGNVRLPKDFFKPLHDAGGKTVAFLPPFIVRINYRNHRKLAIIDSNIAYIGGFNVGDEYLGITKRYGHWRDAHFRIKGDAIDQIQIRFIMDWNFSSKELKDQIPLDLKYLPKREQFDGIKMQIVSSGPDTEWKNIRNGYFKMINEAEKNVYLITPYFVPDDGIYQALKVAALSGLDVRIMIPANPDHLFVYWASMSYLGDLLKSGVKCYQYENGFVHAKMICVDGNVASLGTANMDIRSFELNFEVNSFVYDKKTTKLLEKQFIDDLKDCNEITREWYGKRSNWFKFKESMARLISPML